MRLLKSVLVICILSFFLSNGQSADSADKPESPCLSSFFTESLHYTGEGMRRWYEEEGGFMEITKMPYDQLDCKNCHVKSCDQCHLKKSGPNRFSKEKKPKI